MADPALKSAAPQSVLRGSALLFSSRMLGRILGIVREMLCAAYFGVGRAMDSFNLAFTLVSSMRMFFAEQMLTPLIPTYFQRRQKASQAAALLSVQMITTRLNLVALLVSVLLFVFARPLVTLLAPGFDSDSLHLSVIMVRWFAVGGIAFILHRYYAGLFMCFFQYTVISFAPLVMNVVSIAAIVFFAVRFGVISLAAGFSLGFLAFFFIQAFFLPHRQAILKPHWGRADPGVSSYLRMLYPLFIAVALEQVQLFVDRALASHLPEGALSAQGYALRLIRTSSELWISTFGAVIFPIFSSLAANERRSELARSFSLAFQAVALFLLITGALMLALALPTVRLFLERGTFTQQDSLITAKLLSIYTVGYVAQALLIVIIRGFHSLGDMKKPMFCTLISATVMIIADFLLVGPFGIYGLAYALTIGYVLNVLISYALFHRHLNWERTSANLRTVLLGFALALPIGWLAWSAWALLEAHNLVGDFLTRLLGILFISGLGMALYFIILRWLKVPAILFIWEKVRNKALGLTGNTDGGR